VFKTVQQVELISGIQSRKFHCISSETALIFNSGYDANVGFGSIPQKDLILFDELCHASRDGIGFLTHNRISLLTMTSSPRVID
jgi:hypothetical protein